MQVNNLIDLEKVILEESPKYPGFYIHPDNRKLAANRNGEIINLKTGKILKPVLNKYGRFQIVFSSICKDDGKIKFFNHKVHRVLARIFIGRPSRHLKKSFSDLEVNHIDGNIQNNQLSNLEWVTGKENIIHAHKSGFHSKDRNVIAKSLFGQEFQKFNSVEACAETFGIKKPTLWKHLVKGNSGKFHKLGFIFKFDDGSEWSDFPKCLVRELGESNKLLSFSITDRDKKEIILADGLKNLIPYSKKSTSRLCEYFKKHSILDCGRYLIKKL